ncbi:MAG: hypothetical protein LBT20_02125 [Clostridiales bacterium]|jgi:hypothetical protein|nr:hypothetical protein [Clostridiales bacterium]
MKTHLVRITNDLYDIAARLSEIDGGYRIYYDTRKKRYEIFHENGGIETPACLPPYDRLDQRTLLYVRETRREYTEKMIAEIDGQNRKIEEDREREILGEMRDKTSSLGTYLARGGNDVPTYDRL